MLLTDEKVKKLERKYFSSDFDVTVWEQVESELKNIISTEIKNADELIKMLEKYSELNSIVGEEMAWRYIRMTCYADKKENAEKFNDFIVSVQSKTLPFDFQIKKKFYDSPYRKDLSPEKYSHLEKIIAKDIELFREENVPLQVKEEETANKYRQIIAGMTVTYNGEEKTLAQLAAMQKDQDRKVREETWKLRVERLAQDKENLDKLFDELKELRIQLAKNAGFDNYRDYMHKEKGRFSYTPEDLFKFHDAVEKHVIPFLRELNEERKEKINVESVKPWDTAVEIGGKLPKPFENEDDFVNKAIDILNNVKPEFGIALNKMKNSEFLDLENRKGKAPGGYNYPLMEHASSFIFMNAVGVAGDVRTLLHESGHAMHAYSCAPITISEYKNYPSEVAELASMAMEFLSMPYWNRYYKDEKDFLNAQILQLEEAVKFFPWAMTVDAFQHWLYTNPNHTVQERDEYFASLMDRFNPGVDWNGLEEIKKMMWMFQLHIYQYPFYYIEYAMSQLGALAVYRNYKKSGKKAVENYADFLKLGYSVPVSELYETAGIKFDFSAENIKELVDFVREELKEMKK